MAKNPERVLKALQIAQVCFPDQRIGQLISNATQKYTPRFQGDIFYMEDDELALCLEKYSRGDQK